MPVHIGLPASCGRNSSRSLQGWLPATCCAYWAHVKIMHINDLIASFNRTKTKGLRKMKFWFLDSIDDFSHIYVLYNISYWIFRSISPLHSRGRVVKKKQLFSPLFFVLGVGSGWVWWKVVLVGHRSTDLSLGGGGSLELRRKSKAHIPHKKKTGSRWVPNANKIDTDNLHAHHKLKLSQYPMQTIFHWHVMGLALGIIISYLGVALGPQAFLDTI